MIDTDKYEGYTEGTWRKNLFGCLSQGEMPNIDLDEVSETDAQLIVDAPLLLAEVKRLREAFITAIRYLDVESRNKMFNDMDADIWLFRSE